MATCVCGGSGRKMSMAAKEPPYPLQASEIESFEINFANWLKPDRADAMHHRCQGMP